MPYKLCRKRAHVIHRELHVIDKLVAAGEIHGNGRGHIVHHHDLEAIALDAALIAKGGEERGAKREGRILRAMMLIHLRVSLHLA